MGPRLTDLDEATLDNLLVRLDRRRRELAPPPIPGQRMTGAAASIPATSALQLAPTGSGCCRFCRAPVLRPGICAACSQRLGREERERRLARWLRDIPGRYQDVSWESLPSLRRDDGAPRVTLSNGKSLSDLRGLLCRARRVVLLGPAGSGKSSIAQATLRERWEAAQRDLAAAQLRAVALPPSPAGRSTPHPLLREPALRFLVAAQLREPERRSDDRRVHPLELAIGADVLVLDELGAELEGAQPGSGLLAQRVGPGSAAVGMRFDHGRPTIITTGLDRAAMAALYGDRIARRAFEGAAVIRLGGGPA